MTDRPTNVGPSVKLTEPQITMLAHLAALRARDDAWWLSSAELDGARVVTVSIPRTATLAIADDGRCFDIYPSGRVEESTLTVPAGR